MLVHSLRHRLSSVAASHRPGNEPALGSCLNARRGRPSEHRATQLRSCGTYHPLRDGRRDEPRLTAPRCFSARPRGTIRDGGPCLMLWGSSR